MPKIESVKREGIQRISATICMGQDSQCLPYAGFFSLNVLPFLPLRAELVCMEKNIGWYS